MFLRRAAVALPHSRRFFSTDKTYDISSVIAEMNKEMESVFGECPPSELADSINSNHAAGESRLKPHGLASSNCENFSRPQESQFAYQKLNHNPVGLTHIGSAGEAQMVDVSPKENTKRIAIASCKVILGKKVFDMVLANQMAKGDVLTEDHSVKIEGEAASSGKTGVEMEAMMAVTVAGLTVYDMCKAASKEIQMTDVRLERKSGGKSGDWSRGVVACLIKECTVGIAK
ncbi:hypothetical protein OIU77_010480 [Salix suchowensis]|uniref:Molybdopterin cofactor biosynthesis C (MoaC) domain-containing protein n=1 Tax=Salix suchowensis TaxID=1278906 RepID=A0ABQ9AA95_9ROSI|nr:hypothetical protein OIU77_010480 [Salix suchowensis]